MGPRKRLGHSAAPLGPRHEPGGETLDLDAWVAPLREDTTSGASLLAARAARVVAEAAAAGASDAGRPVGGGIEDLLLRLLEAQPTMAPLVTLAREVLLAVEEGRSPDGAREAAGAAALAFAAGIERGVQEAGRRAARLLPEGGPVLTLSSSATVRATLLEAARARDLEVICLESRPLCEGRTLAADLAGAGISVRYAVDAALGSLLSGSAVLLLGADSVGDLGFVNKIGSRAAAWMARAHGVPLVVAADTSKLLPPGFPQPGDDRPAHEVWGGLSPGGSGNGPAGPPAGVRVWNRYFESLETSLVSLLVTEDGTMTPEEMERHRKRLPVPAALAAWAAARR